MLEKMVISYINSKALDFNLRTPRDYVARHLNYAKIGDHEGTPDLRETND